MPNIRNFFTARKISAVSPSTARNKNISKPRVSNIYLDGEAEYGGMLNKTRNPPRRNLLEVFCKYLFWNNSRKHPRWRFLATLLKIRASSRVIYCQICKFFRAAVVWISPVGCFCSQKSLVACLAKIMSEA